MNITGNRESVRSTLISPFLRHDFGLDAQGEARLSYSTVNVGSSTSAFSDSQATGLDVRIKSGPTYKLLTWNAAYTQQHIDYDELLVRDIDTQRISTGAKLLITPQVGLLANVGYEDNSYLSTGRAPKGAFWNVGTEWNPTPRTRFAATAGRNYEGSTASLDFHHCTRLTVWTASYVQDITTAHAQILGPASEGTAGRVDGLYQCTITDPAARQTAVNAFMDQNSLPPSFGAQVGFNASVPYLVKRLQGSLGIRGVRNTVLANLFTQSREAKGALDQPGAGDFEQSPRIKDSGASVLWTSRLSAQTAAYLNVGFTRNEFVETGFVDKQKFIRLGMTRHFHPRLLGTVSLHRIQNVSSNNAAAYTEHAVSAALILRF
ncbi:MAG: TIGR03016 family PEP-CTERM system-associated outer membrane protein [Betaproteobacteria bacterium]|nr:TIGR03016 family PEP-CTERM system-associated outer membrane protein [Betaproteobacteria bacterium]